MGDVSEGLESCLNFKHIQYAGVRGGSRQQKRLRGGAGRGAAQIDGSF